MENLGSPAPVLVLCRLTSSRCRLRFVHRSFTFRCRCHSFRENKKPCLLCVSRVGKFYGSSIYLLTSGLSKFVSRACPLYDLDRPRLNTQPWLNRLCRVACATDIVGQITVDMYVQVLIERARRLHDERGYVKSFRNLSAIILSTELRFPHRKAL